MRPYTFRPFGAVVTGLTCFGVVFLLLPTLVLAYYAFQGGAFFKLVPDELSLKWFYAAAHNERFLNAAQRSLLIAAVVTPASVILAVPSAFVLVRRDFKLKGLVNALIMTPVLVPSVVSGVAFLSLFENVGLYNGIWRTILAMICFTFPFAVRAIVANLHGIGPIWEEAATSLGAGKIMVWRTVLLPMLKPGLLAAAIFVFVEAIDNFTITVFLVGQKSATLPVEIFQYIADFDDPSVAAVSICLVLFSTLLMMVVERVIGLDNLIKYG